MEKEPDTQYMSPRRRALVLVGLTTGSWGVVGAMVMLVTRVI